MSSGADAFTQLVAIAGAISTPSIREFTLEMMKAAPVSFKEARASRMHHPLDERGPAGNAIHTLRVVKLNRLMADACNYNALATDIQISAATIHDMVRYDLDDRRLDQGTSLEHPLHPRKLAEKYSIACPFAEAIFSIAEKHMGKWGPTSHPPSITPGSILHIADMISAHANEVWELLDTAGSVESFESVEPTKSASSASSSWLGGVPFQDQGMTQDMMILMQELAEDEEYWKTALSFVRGSSSRKWSSLSEKQQDWIFTIVASLEVELNKRTAKELYLE